MGFTKINRKSYNNLMLICNLSFFVVILFLHKEKIMNEVFQKIELELEPYTKQYIDKEISESEYNEIILGVLIENNVTHKDYLNWLVIDSYKKFKV